jgi:AcrR family transcriptional regulator
MRTGTEIKRPRGRPPGFDRETVLRAAGQRFRTHGFAGTSLDELVKATGLARPSHYAAFGDKRALYLAALDRTREWIEASFEALAGRGLPLPDLLKAIFVPTIEGFLQGEQGPAGCIVINTATVEAAHDAQIRARLAEILEVEDRGIATLLAQAGSSDPEAHARLAATTIHSLSIRARAGATREELRRLAKDVSAMIVAASEPVR